MKDFMGLLTSVYCIPWILLIFLVDWSVCKRVWKAVASGKVSKEFVKITGEYAMVCFLMASGVAWMNNFSDVTRMPLPISRRMGFV